MLIMPPGHAANVQRLRRLSERERWILRGVLALVTVLAVAIVVAVGTAGRTSANGCLHLTLPAATGAQDVNECGAVARNTCATVLEPGAYTQLGQSLLSTGCRRAGLPVG